MSLLGTQEKMTNEKTTSSEIDNEYEDFNSSKRPKLTSKVWEEMQRIQTSDGSKVLCKHCGKLLQDNCGTSHLKRHLIICPKRPKPVDITQDSLPAMYLRCTNSGKASMANTTLKRLRLSRNVADNEEVQVDLDFTSNVDGASGSAHIMTQEIDTPDLDQVLYNDFLKQVHESVDLCENLLAVERQNLQQAAFLRYLRRDVIPSYTNVNAELEKVTLERDKALDDLKNANSALEEETKEKTKYQGWYNNARAKYKTANTALTKLREDCEVLKKQPPSASIGKATVAEIVNRNLQKAQAKWKEEKLALVAIAEKVSSESFANAVAQLKLLNPDLIVDGTSAEFEVFEGQICRVDMEKKVYVSVATGTEVGPYVEKDD